MNVPRNSPSTRQQKTRKGARKKTPDLSFGECGADNQKHDSIHSPLGNFADRITRLYRRASAPGKARGAQFTEIAPEPPFQHLVEWAPRRL
jgi:hypothetical protein